MAQSAVHKNIKHNSHTYNKIIFLFQNSIFMAEQCDKKNPVQEIRKLEEKAKQTLIFVLPSSQLYILLSSS